MIAKKGLFTHRKGQGFDLHFNNTSEEKVTFGYSFEDLKEPVLLDSSSIVPNAGQKVKIILVNGKGKSVVLYDCLNGVYETALVMQKKGVILLTREMKIFVEVPVSVSGWIKMSYALFDIATPPIDGFSSLSCLWARKSVTLPKGQKLYVSVKEFDFLKVVVKGNNPQAVTANVNGVAFDVSVYSSPNLFDPLLTSSVYEIENTSNYDFSILLFKQVFNTETFLTHQYLLDRKILHLGIMLRYDYHNTMSKMFFGVLPDIDLVKKERELLLLSPMNEHDKGHYDDYEVPEIEAVNSEIS